jgi:flagellar motor switch protein FliG
MLAKVRFQIDDLDKLPGDTVGEALSHISDADLALALSAVSKSISDSLLSYLPARRRSAVAAKKKIYIGVASRHAVRAKERLTECIRQAMEI